MKLKTLFKYLKLVLLFLMIATNSFAQKNRQETFDSITSNLVVKKSRTFKDLDKSLRKYKRDTFYMKQFKNLAHQGSYYYGEIYAYNMLGRYFRNKSYYEKAEKYHLKAIELAEKSHLTLAKVYSLNMLGVVYRRQDAVRIALDYHFKALNLAKTLDTTSRDVLKNISISENSIANVFNLLENYDLALKHFKDALDIEKRMHNRLGMAINYQNIGSIYESKKDLDNALDYYKKSLTLNESINSDIGRIICKNSIGSVFLEQKKYKEAIALMIPTIELADKVGDNFYKSMANINLGRAYSAEKEFTKAEKYLQNGLQLALDNNFSSATAEAYFHLSNLEEQRHNYRKALHYTKKYSEYENKILNSKNQQYINELIIKIKNKEKNKQIKTLDEENHVVRNKLQRTRKQTYFVLALLVLLSILGSIFYSQNKLNNHRKLVDMKQNLMRTQMNPHFIFNALNSIKLYIINNEKEQAVYYLNKFSKLIRTILNSSTKKEITLKEEIANSKLYVQIENIRFGNSVNFEIIIPKHIPLEEIKVPPLILQPFLENAIWHGLSLKEGEKKLSIELIDNADSNTISILITDNGVGRTKALAIKKERIHHKKSLGIQLTKDRLKAFMKEYKQDFTIVILDLFDANGTANGTQIILKIPYYKA